MTKNINNTRFTYPKHPKAPHFELEVGALRPLMDVSFPGLAVLKELCVCACQHDVCAIADYWVRLLGNYGIQSAASLAGFSNVLDMLVKIKHHSESFVLGTSNNYRN